MRCGFAALVGARTPANRRCSISWSRQGVHRLAQGSDDAALVRGIIIEAPRRSFWSTRPAFSRPNAGSTAPWWRARYRAQRRRRGGAAGRRSQRGDEETLAILPRLSETRAPKLLVLNKIDLVRATVCCAGRETQRSGQIRRDVHDFRAERRWRRQVARAFRRADAAVPLALSRGPVVRRALRILASEITREKLFERCMTNSRINPPSKPFPGPIKRTARPASSRRFSSPAMDKRRS